MRYRVGKYSFKPNSTPKSSTTVNYASRRKHRRRTRQDDVYEDFARVSGRSNHNANDSEFDNQQSENDDEDDSGRGGYASSYAASDSLFDQPLTEQFSSQANSRPISQGTNSILNANSACSASNTPNYLSQPSTQTPSTFMNIAPFPIFRGTSDECPITHLSRFAKVCRANNVSFIDMMTKIFPVTLEDEAALWYDLNIEPYSSSLAWEEIKSSFLQAYCKIEPEEQLRSQLMVINQGNEEPVRSYFLRLQWILMKWPDHGLCENLLAGVFIDGLREDFRDWVIPQKPCSLNEALRLAFSFEQVKCIRDVRRIVPMKCGFCDGFHEEKGCEIRERMRKLWLQSKEGGSSVDLEKKINGSSEAVKEFGWSISMVTSSSSGTVIGKNEVEDWKDEQGEVLGSKKKTQCQCGKHQCWKKKLERNSSNVSGNFKGEY